MQLAADAPSRPALRYYGGKWRLAPWIIGHFPKHQNYVEPCGGAASVLLQKPRSPLETYNDLDGSVVNFFRVLRDRPRELIHRIELTPWARAEYELSLEPCEDEVERARRFFVACWMSYNGGTGSNPRLFGWRHTVDSRLRTAASFDLVNHALDQISSRLIGVQIETRDFREIITAYDTDITLIYFDPPYVQSERTQDRDWYAHEFTEADHVEAAQLLRACEGYVIVSGYACSLYADLYEAHGWHRTDCDAQTNSGGKRVESLWLSPRTQEAINDECQAEKQLMLNLTYDV